MGATPQYGTMSFRGQQSGQLYPIDVYISDVAAAKVRFDGGAGAGSSSDEFITFNEPVILEDFAVITGTSDTEKIRLTAGGKPLPHILRYSIHLNTLATRPELNIPFNTNTRISGFQMAD
jgi:hypothetical protein